LDFEDATARESSVNEPFHHRRRQTTARRGTNPTGFFKKRA